jgi:hypothetical protein
MILSNDIAGCEELSQRIRRGGHVVSAGMDTQIVLKTPELVEMFLNASEESERLDRYVSAPHP